MTIYNPYEVYPHWFDEIEPCDKDDCPYANGQCFNAGFCIMEKILDD